ncbi:uncharacterized protein LOC135209441 [Macrobrachium nipponense]|uniref:uncharacterized protein LOC135209441 n=1 Tax=Macrobrachium nipponense TaxID=159736 RepID=UPI0030C85B35
MPFDLEKFVGAPREHLNTLQEAKKDQLRQIAVRARISVGHAVVKAELLGKIIDFLINSGNITEEEALPLRPLTLERGAARTVTTPEDPEIVKLKLQLELQQRTVEAANAAAAAEQKRLEAANAAAAAEQRKVEAANAAAAAEQRKVEAEQRRLELERKERVLLEKELSAIRIEERLAEIQLPDAFDLSKALKLLPVFDEKDPDVFFITFENTATSLNWPRDQYVLLIRNSFKGKAAYVAAQLVQERDYEVFKTAILDAYSVTAEGYRQIFRQTLKNQAHTYLEFFTLKLKQFNKWIDKEQITTLEQLKNLIGLEEFLRRIPANVSMFIREKQEKYGKRAALLADDYHLIHKLKPHSSSPSSAPQVCTFCKKVGHHIKDCPSPKCKASHGKASPNAFTQGPKSGNTANKTTLHCAQPLSGFAAFTYPGKVNDIPVQIMRDMGSSQTIISSKLKDLAKPTDQYVTVSDLTCQKVLPIVQISLDCPYFKGSTNVALLDSDLPCKNIDMILGNDLAQTNSTPSLIITQPEVVIEKACKEFSPVVELPCQVVTRSTTSTSRDTEHTGKVDQSTLGEKVLADLVDIPSDEFVEYQRSDDSLKEYFDKVKDDVDESKLPYFYLDNNILMRRYRPLKIAGQNSWHDSYQLVVSSNLRAALLDLAHSAVSHLGISKTYKRLLDDYYWPGMKADVKHHIESCHPCQVTGKPNQKIPPAPLVPITVPNSPFEKVIVDCVGPLPKTKKQNEYILTVLCPTTRFPLAIPIKNISARTIIVNLLKIFTIFGFPKELQCDQGTNFTSDLFKQTLKQLNISHIFASAYHPQTNGALERVHQTIKSLLRKYICETGRDWDEDLDLLMYVLRSTPNESTGISPFEMMFGRRPRTNLSMVKENILRGTYKDQQVVHLLSREIDHSTHNSRITTPIETSPSTKNLVPEAVDNDRLLAPLEPDEEETLAHNHILSWKDASNSQILSLLSQYLGHLPEVEREELEAVLKSYPAICSDTPGCCTLVKHDVVLEPNTNPVRQPFYRVSHRLLPAFKAEVEYLLKLDLAAPSKSPWASPCILVKKPNNSYRMCTDYRKVNSVTVKDAYPLPRIADIIDSVSNSKYLTQIDLLKGYYQIKLTDRAKEISAFITPFGLFEYKVLPFGMTNAPATFQRMVHEVTHGLEGVYVYLDDIVIASNSWDEHLKILKELFKRLLKALRY